MVSNKRMVTVTLKDARKDFWTGFRRFIIIRNTAGHCLCVYVSSPERNPNKSGRAILSTGLSSPIYSYQNQGCAKPGVKAEHHGVIHEIGNPPVAREPGLGFDSVRARTTADDTEPLKDTSRVNYSKIVTVEHNVKVMFVGEILQEDWHIVANAVKTCCFD